MSYLLPKISKTLNKMKPNSYIKPFISFNYKSLAFYSSNFTLRNFNFKSYSSYPTTTVSDATMDAVQKRLMFQDECILVDENDNIVGHDTKYKCHLMENIDAGKALHRAFSVYLFNSKYELLLQQRSTTKVTFPLVWTNTCCSHPLYCESELIHEDALGVKNAAQRKLLDELGIPAEHVPIDQLTPLSRMLYMAPSDGKWGEHELAYLLLLVRDVPINPNPNEVADIKYVNRDELREICRKADSGEEEVVSMVQARCRKLLVQMVGSCREQHPKKCGGHENNL